MSANWTAVRRRLAVRRTAHRPPLGGRQLGHSSIVAPLTATIAASVAVGVGVVFAQAERTRRSARSRRRRERRFTQLSGEPMGDALRRMALGQLDLAIELLAGEGSDGGKDRENRHRPGVRSDRRYGNVGAPGARTIHETRKALKRLRALARLLRDELGEAQFKHEHRILGDAGRRLAGARDAEVMVGTLDTLLKRHPSELGGSRPLRSHPLSSRPLIELRSLLVAERAGASQGTLGDAATRAEVLNELRDLRQRVSEWRLPERPGILIVEGDLRRIYRLGRRRLGRVVTRRGRGRRDTRALHEWRKAVKDLRYAAEMLGLRPIARRADALGELLGEEHDLALLLSVLPAGGHAPFTGRRGKQARKALLKQIARRRRRLRKRALREGERLYRRRPKRFMQRARRAHARASGN